MPVTNTPAYPQSITDVTAEVTAANTTLTDSPDDVATLHTFGANGGMLTGLSAIPRATSTAGNLYLYSSNDSGTTKRLIAAVAYSADTVSATDAPVAVDFATPDGTRISKTNPLEFGNGTILYVGYSQALTDGMVFRGQVREW